MSRQIQYPAVTKGSVLASSGSPRYEFTITRKRARHCRLKIRIVHIVPANHPVQPLKAGESAGDLATCGTCLRSWDDSIPTELTPVPAARCPFEYFHGRLQRVQLECWGMDTPLQHLAMLCESEFPEVGLELLKEHRHK